MKSSKMEKSSHQGSESKSMLNQNPPSILKKTPDEEEYENESNDEIPDPLHTRDEHRKSNKCKH